MSSALRFFGCQKPDEVRALLRGVMCRRKKDEVLRDLPEKMRQKINLADCALSKKQEKDLGAGIVERALLSADGENIDTAPDARTTESLSEKLKAIMEAKMPAVKAHVTQYLEVPPGEVAPKFLLFAHHHAMLDELEGLLKSKNVGYIKMDGRTPTGARQEMVHRFQNENNIRVALLSITACNAGITLTAASLVVFAELYWVPGILNQCEDRVHRIGQKNSVQIQYLCVKESLDVDMFRSLNRKTKTLNAMLDGNHDDRHFAL